jgi:hypothetical protein
MLKTTNMLRPVSRTSKVKDLLERLDTVASWWMKVPLVEQRRRQTMSQKGELTPPDQHASIERIVPLHSSFGLRHHKLHAPFFVLFFLFGFFLFFFFC